MSQKTREKNKEIQKRNQIIKEVCSLIMYAVAYFMHATMKCLHLLILNRKCFPSKYIFSIRIPNIYGVLMEDLFSFNLLSSYVY